MRFEELFAWVGAADTIAERRFRRGTLERAFIQADPGTLSDAHREAARALHVDPGVLDGALGDEFPDHAVHVPLVLPDDTGFLRMMHVAQDVSVHGGYELELDPAARRAASDGLSLAADKLRPGQDVGACRFTTTHPEALFTLERSLRLTGPSFGAAAYVSAFSLWSRRPVKPGTVITGRIAGSRVKLVGKLGAKVEAVVRGRADIRRLIVPPGRTAALRAAITRAGLDVHVIEVAHLEELVDAALEPTPRSSGHIRHRVADLRRAFEGGWRGFRWQALRERVERTAAEVPDHRADLQVEVLAMLGAVQEHLGAPLEGLSLLEQAARLVESDADGQWVPDRTRSRLYQHQSMAYRGVGRMREGRAAAKQAVQAARRGRLRDELYKSLGCAGLVEIAAGKPEKALPLLHESLELVHEHAPGSCSRTHGYLVDALGHSGAAAGAGREFRRGLEHLMQQRGGPRRDSQEAWLRSSYASALCAAAPPDPRRRASRAASKRVIELLEVPCVQRQLRDAALPGLWIRRHLGLALCASGRVAEGYTLLADSTTAYGPTMEPGLWFSAQINVMYEARARLRAGDWNQDIAGRVLPELSRLPGYLRSERFVRQRKRTERALLRADSRPAAAASALDRFLSLCTGLA